MVVLIATPSKAEAGACPTVGHISVSMGRSAIPTNVQLRVTFHVRHDQTVSVSDFAGDVGLASSSVLKDTIVRADEAAFIVREKGGGPVSVTTRRLPNTTLPTFLLTPNSPLKPQKRYVVVLRHENLEYRFRYFNTGLTADTTPPKLEGIRKVRFRSRVTSGGKGDTDGPFAQLWLENLTDLEDARPAIEIHDLTDTLNSDASTLRTTQRARFQRADGDSVRFGKTASCTQSNFLFQSAATPVEHVRKLGHMRIGIRAVDLAGNLSTMHVVRLKLK